MMYLSQLFLNPRHRQVQRELSDHYQLHRTIMRAFPPTLPPEERVLHRLELEPYDDQIILLVQSQIFPDWSYLLEKSHYLLDAPRVKSFTLTITAGRELRFRLRANPTVKTSSNRHPHKKTRVPLVHEEKQKAWLVRKGDLHGFQVIHQHVSHAETYLGRKKGSQSIQVFTVRYDGILRVTDAEAFTQAVKSGIGPAKSFGCGLISLAPLR